MSDVEEEAEVAPRKKSRMPMLLGLVLALAGAGGGFYAAWSGMILSDGEKVAAKETHGSKADAEIAYVAMEPLVISLRAPSTARHLKFRAHLEVPTTAQSDVEKVLPRVIDVLNSYLRAVEPQDLEDPAALTRLRAQMLRRVQVVAGDGLVNDLLIMEFVLT